MASVCLPSDAVLQHLQSYLGFSYLGCGVSLHGCSIKVQPLLLTLDEGYLFTATLPDLQRGIAPLGPPAPTQPLLLGRGVAPSSCRPWPQVWGICQKINSFSICFYFLSIPTPFSGHQKSPPSVFFNELNCNWIPIFHSTFLPKRLAINPGTSFISISETLCHIHLSSPCLVSSGT